MIVLSWIFDGVTRVRNWLYDRRVLKSYKVGAVVVSIGNISAGGSGKTPLTDLLLQAFEKRGERVAVLSRGYKGIHTEVVEKVDLAFENSPVKRFGDEPVLLAQRNPGVPVFVGRNRLLAARKILEIQPVRFLILDDGFQHRRLFRNLNILVVDATEDPGRWYLLPKGLGREGLYAVKRSDLAILTKTNFVDDQRLIYWKQILSRYGRAELPVWECRYEADGLFELMSQKPVELDAIHPGDVLLLSGIAKPETFQRLVENELGLKCVQALIYEDHHEFSARDLAKAKKRAQDANVSAILVTEKDAVKLRTLIQPRESSGLPILVVRLKPKLNHKVDKIYEMAVAQMS